MPQLHPTTFPVATVHSRPTLLGNQRTWAVLLFLVGLLVLALGQRGAADRAAASRTHAANAGTPAPSDDRPLLLPDR
jgi:hypothetical protein